MTAGRNLEPRHIPTTIEAKHHIAMFGQRFGLLWCHDPHPYEATMRATRTRSRTRFHLCPSLTHPPAVRCTQYTSLSSGTTGSVPGWSPMRTSRWCRAKSPAAFGDIHSPNVWSFTEGSVVQREMGGEIGGNGRLT